MSLVHCPECNAEVSSKAEQCPGCGLQSPAAAVPTDDELLNAMIGPGRLAYYRRAFDRFQHEQGLVSWNWPAFFATGLWMLYRKMIGYAMFVLFGVPTLLVITANILGTILDNKVVTFWFLIALYLLLGFVLLPLFANRLYYRFVQKKISRARARNVTEGEQLIALYRAGGTSGAALFGFVPFVFVILAVGSAALVIPAERDYATRAQMSEGINLAGGPRAAVLEYFEEHGELPANNEEADISPPSEISSHYVSQVSIKDGAVVILYGNTVNARLFGIEVVLVPDVSKFPDVSWQCNARDIPDKLLISMCRGN